MRLTRLNWAGAVLGMFLLSSCPVTEPESVPYSLELRQQIRTQFPPLLSPRDPADNPRTSGKVELGEALFFDPNLSSCGTVACASCHVPEMGFSDGRKVSVGCGSSHGRRNSNTLYGVAYLNHLFWDGRAPSLEEQGLGPVVDPAEMANSWDNVLHYLSTGEHSSTGQRFPESARFYRRLFDQEFSGEVTSATVTKALAAYERTILTNDSPFDRWLQGDNAALTPAQKKGARIFFGRGQCSECHLPPHFTDSDFHNVGVPGAGFETSAMFPHNERICGGIADTVDPGRAEVVALHSSPADLGRFRTPSLRNVALTAPYMHNGRFSSLESVIQHYWNVGRGTGTATVGTLDEDVRHVMLTDFGGHPDDITNLIAFLNALTGSQLQGPPRGVTPPADGY